MIDWDDTLEITGLNQPARSTINMAGRDGSTYAF
jgi:hypothetical protein